MNTAREEGDLRERACGQQRTFTRHRVDAYLRAHHRRNASAAEERVGLRKKCPGLCAGPRHRRRRARDREQAMIVAMQERATEEQIDFVIEAMVEAGVGVHRTTGATQTILAGVGPTADLDLSKFELLPGVLHVHRISSPYKLAGRSFRPQGTVVDFANGVKVGSNQIVVMAGPCSIEKRSSDLRDRQAREAGRRQLFARWSL